MAVRPELSLNVPTFELPNPLAQMAQVTQIQGAMQQQKIAGMQIEQLEQDRREMLELQQKLSQMGANPDLRVVAQTLMRSPKTLQLGTQMLEKLKEQEGYAALLKRGEPAAAAAMPGAAPAAAGMAPTGAGVNALAPPAATAPVNALLGRGLRSPDVIRREMLEVAQYSNVPQAKAHLKVLETELAEAVKAPTLHNVVGVGAVDPRTGQVMVPEVQRPTSTQQDYDRAVQQGFKGTLLDYKKALAEAGRATTTIQMPPGESAFAQKIGAGLGAQVVGDIDAARNAPNVAARANSVLAAVNENKAFMGPAADFKLQLARALNVTGKGPSEQIAATETLIADLKQSVIEAIKASNLGTGNGFTNKDLEYLVSAKAADIAKDPRTLQEFAERAYKTAQEAAKKGNARLSQNQQVRQQAGVEKFDIPEMVTVSRRSSVRRGETPGATPSALNIPKAYTGDPALWQYMSPEDRALWKD